MRLNCSCLNFLVSYLPLRRKKPQKRHPFPNSWSFKIGLFVFLSAGCVSTHQQEKKADLYHQKALSLIKKCQYPLALAQLKKTLKADRKKPIYHHSIALLYFQFKKYKKSAQHLRSALKLKPDFTNARVHLGRSLIELGQEEEGLKQLKIAQEDLTYPYKERIHIHIGMAHFKKKDYAVAEKHFNVARTVHKEDCVRTLYHAKSLFFLKKYQKALDLLEPAKNRCQKKTSLCAEPSFEPYYFSALSYHKMGRSKRALKDINVFLSKEEAKKSQHFKKALQYQKFWTVSP